MANTINKKQILLIIALFIFLIGAGLVGKGLTPPTIVVSKQDSAINFNSDLVKIFSSGQKRVLADLVWITTLLESDVDHYKNDDLNSWMYLRFKTLFRLDPKFLSGYQFAGKYLSIVKDDLQGAKEIFEQGLTFYPQDYELNIDAGFLYAFELGDFKNAKDRYKIASSYSHAPEFLKSLIVKFDYEVSANKETAYQLLLETYQNLPAESHIQHKMKADLYALKAEIDLECLNSQSRDCSSQDFLGNSYVFKNGKYEAKIPFEKYHFKQKKGGK